MAPTSIRISSSPRRVGIGDYVGLIINRMEQRRRRKSDLGYVPCMQYSVYLTNPRSWRRSWTYLDLLTAKCQVRPNCSGVALTIIAVLSTSDCSLSSCGVCSSEFRLHKSRLVASLSPCMYVPMHYLHFAESNHPPLEWVMNQHLGVHYYTSNTYTMNRPQPTAIASSSRPPIRYDREVLVSSFFYVGETNS